MHLVAVLVQGQVADGEHGVGALGHDRRAPHQGPQPRDDLLEAERLGDVVVAAGGQPGDPVLDGVAGGQEQHGHVRVVARIRRSTSRPSKSGQHHVERDGVGLELAGGPDGGHAGAGGADLPALVAQGHAQQLGEVLLVVDDEDADRRAVQASQVRAGGLCGLLRHAPQCCRHG